METNTILSLKILGDTPESMAWVVESEQRGLIKAQAL